MLLYHVIAAHQQDPPQLSSPSKTRSDSNPPGTTTSTCTTNYLTLHLLLASGEQRDCLHLRSKPSRNIDRTSKTYPVLNIDTLASEPTRWLPRPNKMLQGAHVFSHQQQFNPHGEPAWMHQQTHHHHAQQAAAAAATAAQQQQYNRIAANHNSAAPSIASTHGQEPGIMDSNVSEENRRTLAFIADLLNEDTREAALLELSKKREQVPELALILWHSFGRSKSELYEYLNLIRSRCYDISSSGDHLRLHSPQSVATHSSSFQPRLQCAGTSTMCCFT